MSSWEISTVLDAPMKFVGVDGLFGLAPTQSSSHHLLWMKKWNPWYSVCIIMEL